MRLNPNQIENLLKSPNPQYNLILIHGNTTDNIKLYQRNLVKHLGGEYLNQEMRLIDFSEKEILNEKEILFKELRTKSFFNGPKIVRINNASDKSFKFVKEILDLNLTNSETFLLLISENLTAKSLLRKLIEDRGQSAASIAIYEKNLTRFQINEMIESIGIKFADDTCLLYLIEISDGGNSVKLKNILERLQLAFLNDMRPLGREDIESVVAEDITQNYFSIVENTAIGDTTLTIKEFRRYAIGKQNFNSLVAFLSRYFRNIQNVNSNVNTKVPYFGKAKEKFNYHLKIWTPRKVEKAISLIFYTNIQLRENSVIRDKIRIERMLLNICSLLR